MDSAFMESVDIAEHYAVNPLKIYDPYSRNTSDAKYFNAAGEMKRIFLVDTKDLSIVLPYKANNAPIDFLTKDTMKWLVGKDDFKGSLYGRWGRTEDSKQRRQSGRVKINCLHKQLPHRICV